MRWPTAAAFPNSMSGSLTPSRFPSADGVAGVAFLTQEMRIPLPNNHASTHKDPQGSGRVSLEIHNDFLRAPLFLKERVSDIDPGPRGEGVLS